MLDWGIDKDGKGEGAYGVDNRYYRVIPTPSPKDETEAWTVLVELDDEEGTVEELGRFKELADGKFHAETDHSEKFLSGEPDISELDDD